jgi:hypothetical protein
LSAVTAAETACRPVSAEAGGAIGLAGGAVSAKAGAAGGAVSAKAGAAVGSAGGAVSAEARALAVGDEGWKPTQQRSDDRDRLKMIREQRAAALPARPTIDLPSYERADAL